MKKRLFFGFEAIAPWPDVRPPPRGRTLQESERHLTVAFLGDIDYGRLEPLLATVPLPPFLVGLAGYSRQLLLLPKVTRPNVAAWEVAWLQASQQLVDYVHLLGSWLREHTFPIDDRRDFLPHVTLCRAPLDAAAWQATFQQLPLVLGHLHLYESIGSLRYQPIWTHHLHLPFEEVDHTADLAFLIRGETVPQLFYHALAALAFKMPNLLKYRKEELTLQTVDDVVIALNEVVSDADSEVGCPFKAVSFHGEIVEENDHTLSWEMIVDV